MGNSPEIEVCFFLTEAFKMQICVKESYLHLSILNWNWQPADPASVIHQILSAVGSVMIC
jgi:ubiquitin-protein ligase